MESSGTRTYIAIDLKSFYASAECAERGLDPLRTNLVVADRSRTNKTICLAVSPSLKALGIPGRPRLFEVVRKVDQVNMERLCFSPEGIFTGRSVDADELERNPALEVDYIVAPPRMSLYMAYSAKIYGIYLRHIAAEDIHVYSVDEVFIDATNYLQSYRMTPRELTAKMIGEVLRETGITATAGIGTNLYLCKIAMDITAKHMPADKDGVRIAELDEASYRRQLWSHRPLTDFWRIGRGISHKLQANGMHTMGDVARQSVVNDELLYKLFGVNAELLIDHAWGWEPCTMADIKGYRPSSHSLSQGQVLAESYTNEKARIVVREMADSLALDLVAKGMETNQVALYVGYDSANINDGEDYDGEVVNDFYGRPAPKPAHGSANLGRHTSASTIITKAMMDIFDAIVDPRLAIRRLNVAANNVRSERQTSPTQSIQMDIFTDYEALAAQREKENATLEKERRMQRAAIDIKRRFGKNALLRGTNFEDGATGKERNRQVGGHKA